jgi:hypothetical protein
MNKHCLTFVFLIFLLPTLQAADDTDSTFTIPPQDSTITDSTAVDSLAADSMAVDSIGVQGGSFEERYDEFVKSRQKHQTPISYFDTLMAYFASERMNRMPQVQQSYYNDAGDYFRSDPTFLILEHQLTPMRKTVQPFGLPGGRLNYLIKDMPLRPFEHMPEPDGSYDMNDFPTGADDAVYIMPGATGYLFGGQEMLASAIAMPADPETSESVSGILADKGSFGYAYTRGHYSKNFDSGRQLDLSIDYRATDGLSLLNDDDAYHYWGDAYFPMGVKTALRVKGQLYNRNGHISIRQNAPGKLIPRERFDRNLTVSFEFQNDDTTTRSEIGYQHLRQGSYTTLFYRTRFNITGHGAFGVREWVRGSSMYQARIYGNQIEYDQGFNSFDRIDGGFSLGVAHTGRPGRWAARVGGRYVEDFDFLPSAAVQYMRETDRSLLSLSLGYAHLEPTLHELHKLYQEAVIYQSSELPYADEGNPDLTPEKQLVGSVTYEYGTLRNRLNLTLTGGRLFDGIQWQRGIGGALYDVILFSPVNTDIDFANATLRQTVSLGDFVKFSAGGAYHYIDFEKYDLGAYQPEYQLFSGLELHVYWVQKLMHLFAYSEIVVTGLYDGYARKDMGETAIVNTKLSFRLKDFRFHYVFQNMLSVNYESREYQTIPGRFSYYGITWTFFN